MDELIYWKEEAAKQRLRADREQHQKGGWLLSTFLLGLFTLMVIYSKVRTPRSAQWDVDYEKPIVTLVTFSHWWSGAERTEYAWGKADNGEEGWLPVDKYGHTSKDADEIKRAYDPPDDFRGY